MVIQTDDYVCSYLSYLICLRHFFRSKAQLQIRFFFILKSLYSLYERNLFWVTISYKHHGINRVKSKYANLIGPYSSQRHTLIFRILFGIKRQWDNFNISNKGRIRSMQKKKVFFHFIFVFLYWMIKKIFKKKDKTFRGQYILYVQEVLTYFI